MARICLRFRRPKEGTNIRKIYDWLQEHKGYFVKPPFAFQGAAILYLKDMYGQDIFYHSGRYALLGEWVGKVYIDHSISVDNASKK